MFKGKKLNKYIISEYIKIFLIICFVLISLIIIIKFLELSKKTYAVNLSTMIKLRIVLFEIPKILEEFIQFIIVISSAICIKRLSSRNELTILNNFGFSLWKILQIYTCMTTIIALSIIFIFNPISSKLDIISQKIINTIKNIANTNYAKINLDLDINTNVLYETNGFWFMWQDIQKNNMIIKSNQIDISNYIFFDNSIFIFDKYDDFIKRIECDKMTLKNDGTISLTNTYIYQKNNKIKKQNNITINTNVDKYYINQELINKYGNIDYINIYEVIKLLKKFSKIKLNITKFKTKLVEFLIIPISYFVMNMFACIIINNNNRTTNSVLELSLIVIVSIIYHIIQSILYALSYANKINVIFSNTVWLSLNILVCSYMLIKKIELNNK